MSALGDTHIPLQISWHNDGTLKGELAKLLTKGTDKYQYGKLERISATHQALILLLQNGFEDSLLDLIH
jgi:hypothetical protein